MSIQLHPDICRTCDHLIEHHGEPGPCQTRGCECKRFTGLAWRLSTSQALRAELYRARSKFPGNRFLLAALSEEVGELAQAMLQKKPRAEIVKEALQVATVAIRIAEEGDASFDDLTDAEAKP